MMIPSSYFMELNKGDFNGKQRPFCFGDKKRRPTRKHVHMTNVLPIDRVAVCKNLTCPNIQEYNAIDHCPDCNKRMALTTSGSGLFELIP